MAHKQIGARTEGDVFQGLFFWKQAAGLFIPRTLVQRVILEHDEASGVDDVAVFYSDSGIDAGGYLCTADYYQLKYHIDRRDMYSAAAIIDPSFIGGESSLLQRFYNAYKRLVPSPGRFRLNLASNWRCKDDDLLASAIREYDGALPDAFYTDSKKCKMGKIREEWCTHLGIDINEFKSFAMTLRFQLDHFGRCDFREMVHDRLSLAGLSVPDSSHAASPYESLVQQFLMNGPHSFDSESLRRLCEKEGLFSRDQLPTSVPKVAVRSLIRFAEGIEGESDEFLCVASQFIGRHPRDHQSWASAAQSIVGFFAVADRRARLRSSEHSVLLECHGSLSLLTGYELSRNSGCLVYPIQKPKQVLWKPKQAGRDGSPASWQQEIIPQRAKTDDIAVSLSVANDITADVIRYLKEEEAPPVSCLLSLKPATGNGQNSIQDPDHASQLAAALIPILRDVRPVPTGRVHLFMSAPNGLLFFIGQYREALGKVVLYEYDYSFERHCSYKPCITLP